MMLVVLVVALLALFLAALLAPAPLPPVKIKPRWKGCPVWPLQRWRGEWRGWVLS